jgi:pectate lyase
MTERTMTRTSTRRRSAAIALGTTAIAMLAVPTPAAAHGGMDLGRQVLGENDGWAAAEGGTTGGAAADDAHVFVVDTWAELNEALGGDDARYDTTPRIVYVKGVLDAMTDAEGEPIACEDIADPEYSFDAYIEEYSPENWGVEEEPFGPLEDARERSYDNHADQIRQYVGSNTTIVGLGRDAGIVGGSLMIRDADNVIVRNLRVSDAYDCFPQWDPTDGDAGAWNTEFDNIAVRTSTHVWIDHVTLDDGEHPSSSLPTVLGVVYEVHDGLLDITHGSDLVTVSWSRFLDHDKTMLIGSTNRPTYDVGKLRVTLHHNLFDGIVQRAPRIRYGQVHVYNNSYRVRPAETYQYSWGIGVESRLYAESNAFDLAPGIEAADLLVDWGGTVAHAENTMVDQRIVDVLAAYNAEHDPDLGTDVGWEPVLHTRVHDVRWVPWLVEHRAGAGKLSHHWGR